MNKVIDYVDEEEVLRRLVAARYLTSEDLAWAEQVAATAKPTAVSPGGPWGPRLQALVQSGRLPETVVRAVSEKVPASAPDETAPPSLPDAAAAGSLAPAVAAPAPSLVLSAAAVGDDHASGSRETYDSSADPTLEPSAQTESTISVGGDLARFAKSAPYELLGILGQGGMGVVYKARDRRLGRLVALKFLHGGDDRMVRRFMQEARTQARIDHPNICKIHEVGEINGKVYIAMPYVSGQPLNLAAPKLLLMDKVQIIKSAAEALHVAHQLGIIHRDIKPANIMVESLGPNRFRPVIMDFGLAREANEGEGLTESGMVLGTPAFMSPEQAAGKVRSLDCRTDVYSLGATLFFLLTGQPPLLAATSALTIIRVIRDEPPLLRELDPTLPKGLETIVSKALNKEALQRYQNAQALAEDLGRYLNQQRIVGRRVSLAYRLWWRARQNRAVTALLLALFVSLLGLAGYGIRTQIERVHRERLARQQARLAQELGQSIERLEWLVRSAYTLPLHDTEPDLAQVRTRMAEIDRGLRSYGEVGTGLGHYALGRGHLALHAWDEAYGHLKLAEELGVHDQELDYALGRAMGELFNHGLEQARRSGDKNYVAQRRKELERELLTPALAYLERSRSVSTVSPSYLQGLIDYYTQRHDAALLHGGFARRQTPWLYEAAKLQGDVYLSGALEQRDRGENDTAENRFAAAIHAYEEAAEIGRSDSQLHEALAEAWVRREEMHQRQGKDPTPALRQAVAAAERAIEASPRTSSGHTKKAYAFMFQERYLSIHGGTPKERLATLDKLIASGEAAVSLQPEDVYARNILGIGYQRLANYHVDRAEAYQEPLDQARRQLHAALDRNPHFPWAYNDLALTYLMTSFDKGSRDQDPHEDSGRAVELFEKALAEDAQYLSARKNLIIAYYTMYHWLAAHGQDPSESVQRARARAQQTLSANPRQPDVMNLAAWSHADQALYQLYSGQDPRPSLDAAQASLGKIAALSPDFFKPHEDAAYLYALQAWTELHSGRDPTAALALGLRACARCAALHPPPMASCTAYEALLHAQSALWAQRQRSSPALALTQARSLAERAEQAVPSDPDGQMALAQAWVYLAGIKLARGMDASDELSRGQTMVHGLLGRAPTLPRSLLQQAVLYKLQAHRTKEQSKRQALRQMGRDALQRAAEQNPLFRSFYKVLYTDSDETAELLTLD